jgi:hypothetical protein
MAGSKESNDTKEEKPQPLKTSDSKSSINKNKFFQKQKIFFKKMRKSIDKFF